MVNKHGWSDAWLLLAAGITSSTGSSTLTQVIGAADGIQHAIMTKEELVGGIRRLTRAGYMTFEGGAFTLTESGRDIIKRTTRYGQSYLRQQEAVERLLQRQRTLAENGDEGDDSELLTDAEYDQAIHAYYDRVGIRDRKRGKP
jgi:hypothetical protein